MGDTARILMQDLPRAPFGRDWALAAAHRCEVHTFMLTDQPGPSPAPTDPSGAGAPHRVDPVKLRGDRFVGSLSDRATTRRFVTLVEGLQERIGPIDVIHGHFYAGARFLPLASRQLGIPFVVTEHSTRLTGRSADHKPFTARNRRTARRVYGAAGRVIAVSEHLRTCIEEAQLAQDVRVIPNPVTVGALHDAARRDPHLVVAVGRLEADKRPLLLLDAIAWARRTEPRLRFELLGAGPALAEVRARAAQPDLAGAVEVRGKVARSDVFDTLARAACFALGSSVETFCMAAAEAVVAGVPVVMPDLPAVREVVGPLGRLVAADPTAAELGAAILDVLAAPPDAWPDQEREARRTRFAPASVGDALADLYAEVLS